MRLLNYSGRGRARAAAHAFVLTLAVAGSAAIADVRDDVAIQHGDDQFRRSVVDPSFTARIHELLAQGYPLASVLLHAVSLGVPIDDVVEMSVRQQPADAERIFDVAASMLPSLPGWACRANDTNVFGNRRQRLTDMDGVTLAQIAARYFAGDLGAEPIPDWKNGDFHVEADVDEIVRLGAAGGHWYQESTATGSESRPVFVSLYRDRETIVVDGEGMRRAERQGRGKVPVVVLFNETFQRPVSDYTGDTSIADVAYDFFNRGEELTAVPDWHRGDYHLLADIDELQQILAPGDREAAASPQAQSQAPESLHTAIPLKVTLLREGARVWVDEPQKLAHARKSGQNKLPVVFYYHHFNRLPCGAAATSCLRDVCRGVVDGGGDPSICQRYTGADGRPLIAPATAGIGTGQLGPPAIPPATPPSISPPSTASPK